MGLGEGSYLDFFDGIRPCGCKTFQALSCGFLYFYDAPGGCGCLFGCSKASVKFCLFNLRIPHGLAHGVK